MYYGLGTMVYDIFDRGGRLRWLGHSGGGPGISAVVAYDIDRRAFVAAVVNGGGTRTRWPICCCARWMRASRRAGASRPDVLAVAGQRSCRRLEGLGFIPGAGLSISRLPVVVPVRPTLCEGAFHGYRNRHPAPCPARARRASTTPSWTATRLRDGCRPMAIYARCMNWTPRSAASTA